jgi:predicted acetyltransferase
MTDVSVRRASDADRPTVERLWPLFRHDMSEFRGDLTEPDGTFRNEWVQAAFTDTADRVPYLLTSGERPVGFAFVRALTEPERVMNSFFVVRGARRTGMGLRAAAQVLRRHPGRWGIPFQDTNTKAVRFWRRVATEVAGSAWTAEHRPIPGRPDVPPDVWISLEAPARTSD